MNFKNQFAKIGIEIYYLISAILLFILYLIINPFKK